MAACKAMLDAAHGVAGSSLVTAMARNGVEFGIRLSGTGDAWFTAPAPVHRRAVQRKRPAAGFSIAAHNASMYAVLPANCWAR